MNQSQSNADSEHYFEFVNESANDVFVTVNWTRRGLKESNVGVQVGPEKSRIFSYFANGSIEVAYVFENRIKKAVVDYKIRLPRFFFRSESDYGCRGQPIQYGDLFYLYHLSTGLYAGLSKVHRGHAVLGDQSCTFKFMAQGGKKLGDFVNVDDCVYLHTSDNSCAQVRRMPNRSKTIAFKPDKVNSKRSDTLWKIVNFDGNGEKRVYEGDIIGLTEGKDKFLQCKPNRSTLESARSKDEWIILRFDTTAASLRTLHYMRPSREANEPLAVPDSTRQVDVSERSAAASFAVRDQLVPEDHEMSLVAPTTSDDLRSIYDPPSYTNTIMSTSCPSDSQCTERPKECTVVPICADSHYDTVRVERMETPSATAPYSQRITQCVVAAVDEIAQEAYDVLVTGEDCEMVDWILVIT